MEIINKEVYAGKEYINVGVDIDGKRLVRVLVIQNYSLDVGSRETELVEITDDYDFPLNDKEEKEILELVKKEYK